MIITKSFIHPIAENYFDKIESAGGTVQDKNSINNFIIELSKIISPELWACWSFQSSQNIGTGTTAFSFGGLGNFNATLINGPTWGTSGITALNSTSVIEANYAFPPEGSMFVVGKAPPVGTHVFMQAFKYDIAVLTNDAQLSDTGVKPIAAIFYNNTNGFNFFAGTIINVSGGNVTGRIVENGSTNLNTTIQESIDYPPDKIYFLNRRNQDLAVEIVSFAMVIPVVLTLEQIQIIRQIYKRTLGIGLNLP